MRWKLERRTQRMPWCGGLPPARLDKAGHRLLDLGRQAQPDEGANRRRAHLAGIESRGGQASSAVIHDAKATRAARAIVMRRTS